MKNLERVIILSRNKKVNYWLSVRNWAYLFYSVARFRKIQAKSCHSLVYKFVQTYVKTVALNFELLSPNNSLWITIHILFILSRYGEAPRNGLHSMSARSKYSEPPQSPQQQQQHQNGPVNLAVSSNLPSHTQHGSSQSAGLSAAKLNQLSHEFHERSLQAQARAHAHAQQQHQQQQQHRQHQEQQKESVTDLGKLYSPTNPRLAFFPSPLDANSYAGLNYGLYPFG